MKRILAFALALFASSAFATLQLVPDNVNTNTNLNSANAMQGQLQGQVQGQFTNVDVSNRISNDTRAAAASFAAGGLGVGQGGVGQAVSGGSTSNVDFNITSPKNTPAVFAGNMYPTTSCAHTLTVGGSGVGFGLAIGSSWTDEECSLRETARSFQGLGKVDDAIHILCSSKFSAAAPTCKSIAPRPEQQ